MSREPNWTEAEKLRIIEVYRAQRPKFNLADAEGKRMPTKRRAKAAAPTLDELGL